MGRYEVRENGFGGVAENFGMRSLELTRKWFEGNIIQKIQKLWESGLWYIIGNVAGRSLVGVCGKVVWGGSRHVVGFGLCCGTYRGAVRGRWNLSRKFFEMCCEECHGVVRSDEKLYCGIAYKHAVCKMQNLSIKIIIYE